MATFTRNSRANRRINFRVSADHCDDDVAHEYFPIWNGLLSSLQFSANIQLETRHKEIRKKGIAVEHRYIQQLHDRVVFVPISINESNKLERKIVTESLSLLNRKRDKNIKTRMCANGSTQQEYVFRKEARIPTALSEAIITTGVIDEKQKIYVIVLYIPNVFVHIYIILDRDKIIMNIRGKLVNILLEIFTGVYNKYVRYKGKQNILYVRMLKALYRILVFPICTTESSSRT